MNGKTGLAAFYHYPVRHFIHHHKSKGWLLAAFLILVFTLLPIYAETTVVIIPDSQGSLTAGVQETVEVNPQAARIIKESEIMSAFSYLIPAAGTLAGWGLWAGCLYTGILLMGRRTTYQLTFRMIVFSWIPIAVRELCRQFTFRWRNLQSQTKVCLGWLKHPQSCRSNSWFGSKCSETSISTHLHSWFCS